MTCEMCIRDSPKAVLQKEIRAIEMSGVKIHLNTKVGTDISFEDMKKQSDAIYIAAGTQVSRLLDVPGEDLKGCLLYTSRCV